MRPEHAFEHPISSTVHLTPSKHTQIHINAYKCNGSLREWEKKQELGEEKTEVKGKNWFCCAFGSFQENKAGNIQSKKDDSVHKRG